MGLLEALKQYASDAVGGSLNPEVGNTLSGLLNYGKDRAKYIGGLLDDSSPINKDFKNWHDRTQLGLADLIAGKDGPQADYGYSQIMNMAGVAPLGITAWHGSPHKFDKFSLDKIGTGEGAQAYGHGLYLAENPETASMYRASVAPKQGPQFGLEDGNPVKGIATLIAAKGAKGEEMARKHYAKYVPDMEAAIQQAKQAVNEGSNLYKTDIPDEAVARFLDWDKPLSQQAPEVQAALLKADKLKFGKDRETLQQWIGMVGNDAIPMRQTGSDLVSNESGQVGGSAEMSQYLREIGIPGIRYLDGGSRSTGQGSSNFVAFDPEMIRILERNGQPTGQHPWALGEWLKRQK